MDRNTITGVILIVLILLGFNFFFSTPDASKTAAKTAIKDTVTAPAKATVVDKAAEQKADSAKLPDLPAVWASFAKGENKEIALENKKLKLRIASKGGKISFAELKEYKAYNGKPLILQNENSGKMNFYLPTSGATINTEDLYFNPESVTDRAVTMAATLPDGKSIKQVYTLDPDSFVVHYHFILNGFDQVIPKKETRLELDWQGGMLQQEQDSTISKNNMTIFYKPHDANPDYMSETKYENIKDKKETDWISFKQQFFCQTLITNNDHFETYDLTTETGSDGFAKTFKANLTLPYTHKAVQDYDMRIYYGPLHYGTLSKMNLDMERQIPLGWSFFLTSWVNRFIVIPVFNFLRGFGLNMGIIILLLTIYIKLIVLPFTYRSYLSTAKMKLLKPELDEMKAKFQGDMAKQQQEQMKLYRRAGVSPFGGCLPLLFQFPILIAMFRFFPSSFELRQQSFLWAKDLSVYDSVASLPFSIPFYGNHVSLFTILMTISTILYTRMNNSISTQQKEMQWMSYLMPIMFLGFFNQYSAGLSLYYFGFNILTFVQQYLFKIFINEKKLKAKIEANKKKPETAKKTGGLQKRLEEMQKKQQTQIKNRGRK